MLLLLLSGITVNAQLQNCSHLQRSNGFQRHSQGDQDGILRDIFNTIGVTNRCAVEFGFGYHITLTCWDFAGRRRVSLF